MGILLKTTDTVADITRKLRENTLPKICDKCNDTYQGTTHPITDDHGQIIPGMNQCNNCFNGEIVPDSEVQKNF